MMREHEWRMLQMNILAAIAGAERAGHAMPPNAALERLSLHLSEAAALFETVRAEAPVASASGTEHAAAIGRAAD